MKSGCLQAFFFFHYFCVDAFNLNYALACSNRFSWILDILEFGNENRDSLLNDLHNYPDWCLWRTNDNDGLEDIFACEEFNVLEDLDDIQEILGQR